MERPNEVWSWDITRLRGPLKWTYFYLYVILNIASRYVVQTANRDDRAERAQRHLGRYILVTGSYRFALSSKKKHWHKSRKIVQ